MIPKVQIDGLGAVLPPTVLTSTELERDISSQSPNIFLPSGIIEILTGVQERRIASPGVNASDLATDAAQKALLDAGLENDKIDCLIFASAGGDIIEPATANIIQENLKLGCPVIDIKNACNSFLNGMQVAESFIVSGKYKKILIANGEIPSRAVRRKIASKDQLKQSFAGFTLGDAGAAMILGVSDGNRGILYSQFNSYGKFWRQSAVLGGGTRFPRDPEKLYFEGETAGLKDIFIKIGPKQLHETLEKVGWTMQDIDCVVIHQVSMKSFDYIVKESGLPYGKLVIVLPKLGNMVSASIPVTLDAARQTGQLKKGDKVLLLGLAAGVSIGTMALIW